MTDDEQTAENDALTYADGIETAARLAALYDTGEAAAAALTVAARISREVTAARPIPPTPDLRVILHEVWLRIHGKRFDTEKPDSFYNGIIKAERVVHEVATEHGINWLALRESTSVISPAKPEASQ